MCLICIFVSKYNVIKERGEVTSHRAQSEGMCQLCSPQHFTNLSGVRSPNHPVMLAHQKADLPGHLPADRRWELAQVTRAKMR